MAVVDRRTKDRGTRATVADGGGKRDPPGHSRLLLWMVAQPIA